jgi:hypothetical protein
LEYLGILIENYRAELNEFLASTVHHPEDRVLERQRKERIGKHLKADAGSNREYFGTGEGADLRFAEPGVP